MFALKDESYLRHTVQRQAARLHQATVSYAVSRQRLTIRIRYDTIVDVHLLF